MARDFDVNLDKDDDPLRELGRSDRGSDHLVLSKSGGFRVTGVERLFPEPTGIIPPSDPEYPFVKNAAGAANQGGDGRFRKKTPDLKNDNGVKFQGNHYMLKWEPDKPPKRRPGPHYKVFP
jgi:hypothetical protein